MSHINRLIVNSFPQIENFEENVRIEIEQLENARSFWSECYRVKLEPKNEQISLPSPLFVKIPRISQTNSLLEADNEEENTQILLKLTEREVCFLTEFRRTPFHSFPLPTNYFAENIDFSQKVCNSGGLVFDDLSGFTYSIDYIPGFSDTQVKCLMEALAGFHFTTISLNIEFENYNNDLYDADYMNMLHHDTLDLENLRPELFSGKIQDLKWIFAPDSVQKATLIDKEIGMPEVLSHNDMNATNILWDRRNDKIAAIIDWQHAARGSIPFDIIRILSLGLSKEDRRSKTNDYLLHYYNAISKLFTRTKTPFSFEQLLLAYKSHFAFTNATTLFGICNYYKMYKEESIDLSANASEHRNSHAEELLSRAIGIIEDINESEGNFN